MAQPKRRWSKARTGLKRSTWKIEEKNLATCPHCHEPVMQHRERNTAVNVKTSSCNCRKTKCRKIYIF